MTSPPSPSCRGGHCSTSVYCIDAVINVTSLLVSMIESSHVSQLNMAITLIIISLYGVAHYGHIQLFPSGTTGRSDWLPDNT